MLGRILVVFFLAAAAHAGDIHDEFHACQFERLRVLKKSNFQATTAADQFCVGYGYWLALEGLPHDPVQSAQWMARAAQQGHPGAETVLGYDYEQGHGVPRDFARAVFWIRKAVDQGYPDAMFHLGRLYSTGKGVPQNAATARQWFEKAAASCADGVIALREDREYQMEAPARETANRAYQAYQSGDYAAAASLYRVAAQAGNPAAQVALGTLLRTGKGVAKDVAAGAAWYRKAADQNYAAGLSHLGLVYELGEGVPTDWPRAEKLCQASARQFDKLGLYCFARDFQFGIGVAQDRAHAIRLFDRAMDAGDGISKFFSQWLRDPNNPVGFRDDPEREHYLLAWADPHGIRFNSPQERNQWLGQQNGKAAIAGSRAYAATMNNYQNGMCQAAGGNFRMGNCYGSFGIFNPTTQDKNGNGR